MFVLFFILFYFCDRFLGMGSLRSLQDQSQNEYNGSSFTLEASTSLFWDSAAFLNEELIKQYVRIATFRRLNCKVVYAFMFS